MAFTEEFKYLIVTSSLLNESVSVRSKSVARSNEPPPSSLSDHTERWNAAAYGLGFLIMIGANRASVNHLPGIRRTLHTTITSSLSMAATFMMYRNMVSINGMLVCDNHKVYSVTIFLSLFCRRGNHFDTAIL
jgi:hypothetical protein